MYPLLIAAIIYSTGWTSHSKRENAPAYFHQYDPNDGRADYIRVPLVSNARTQAWKALSYGNDSLSALDSRSVRWRVALAPADTRYYPNGFDLYNAVLELYMNHEGDSKGKLPMQLIAEYPLIGKDFENLPLVQRLGLELLWRVECNPKGPE